MDRLEITTKLEVATDALRDILAPLGKLTRDAEASGGKLNGYAATLIRDPIYLQQIAREALEKIGDPTT